MHHPFSRLREHWKRPEYRARFACTLLLLSAGCLAGESRNGDAAAWLHEALLPRDVRVHFSDPRPGVSSQVRTAARDRIVGLIDSARESLEVWAYGLDEAELIAALVRATERGVSVQIHGSPDQTYVALRAAFARRLRRPAPLRIRQRSGLQHVKLMLIDGQRALTGTGNFTRSGLLFNHNAFLEFQIAPVYQEQWAALRLQLLEVEPESQNRDRANAGFRTKNAAETPVLTLAPGVQAMIGPARGRLIQSALLREVFAARESLRFLIFSFTDPLLAAAFALQARAGVHLEGILDDPTNRGELRATTAGATLNASLGLSTARIYLEGNRRVFALASGLFAGGHLHHKTLLIDDATVLTGSYNWSLSARDRNLELFLLIRRRPFVAAAFRREFERIRADAQLLDRPPAENAPAASTIAPRWLPDSGLLCLPPDDAAAGAPAAQRDLIVFAGRGPYLRGLHLQPRRLQPHPANELCAGPCYDPRESANAASGIRTGSGAPALPIVSAHSRFAYTGLALSGPAQLAASESTAANAADAELPCARGGSCVAIDLRAAGLDADSSGRGWVWPAAGPATPHSMSSMRIWDRGGLGPRIALHATASGTGPAAERVWQYALPDGGLRGDALLFFYDATGQARGLACVQRGDSLDRQLRAFLNLRYLNELEHGAGPEIACAKTL